MFAPLMIVIDCQMMITYHVVHVDEPMRIKLKWKCSKSDSSNGGYDVQVITDIFTKVCLLLIVYVLRYITRLVSGYLVP